MDLVNFILDNSNNSNWTTHKEIFNKYYEFCLDEKEVETINFNQRNDLYHKVEDMIRYLHKHHVLLMECGNGDIHFKCPILGYGPDYQYTWRDLCDMYLFDNKLDKLDIKTKEIYKLDIKTKEIYNDGKKYINYTKIRLYGVPKSLIIKSEPTDMGLIKDEFHQKIYFTLIKFIKPDENDKTIL